METVQIKVNTFNRIKKIREGIVYDSITTVIDELLQNCQRSFSICKVENPTIDISIGNGNIIIRDNGDGCDDPQDIFEFEKSGWDIPGAFGQGGSESVFQIADVFIIRSQDWRASVNVLDILTYGNMNIEIEDKLEYWFKGYEIHLSGQKILNYASLLEDHIRETVKYFDCSCFVNEELIEKENIRDFNSEFKLEFDNPNYTATLGVQTGYRDIEFFYEKRKVCDKWIQGVYGKIELKQNAVDLKAPDRKSIIYNSKHTKLIDSLKEDCKMLYLQFVQQATLEQFNKYENGIDNTLTAQDYEDYLPYYEEIKHGKKLNRLEEEVPSTDTVKDKSILDDLNFKASLGGVYVSQDKTIEKRIELKDDYKAIKGEFKQRLGKILNLVWCEFSRTAELQELINMAEEHKIKVIFSKGKLYDKVFTYWGIPHIEYVMETHEAKFIIGQSSYTSSKNERYYKQYLKKEERLMNVLNKIEEFYNLKDVFKIAEIKEHLYIEKDGEVVMDTTRQKSIAPVKDRNRIYLDRASLNLEKIDLSESKSKITKFDILIVLLNIQTISNGLSQILYGTIEKTVDHMNRTEKIGKEIALLLASL